MKKAALLPDIPGVFCLLSFACLLLLGGGKALQDADTLWHIRAGQEMLAQGRILETDIFSHTAFGKPWIAHEWLAEVIMAAIHQLSGLPGVVIFYFLLVAATFWILFKTAALKSANEWLAILCVSVAFLLAYTHLLARPHIFSWLLGAITLYILVRDEKRSFYLLPLLTVLWVNLHGGFILGLLLQILFIGSTLLDERPRPFTVKALPASLRRVRFPMVILLLSILASGINPFGYKLLLFSFQVTSEVFTSNIAEWRSPDLQHLWYFRFYILAIMALLLFGREKPKTINAILILTFFNYALTHVRHISIAGLMLTPVLADLLSNYFPKRQHADNQLLLSSKTGPLATCILAALAISVLSSKGGQTTLSALYPIPERFSAGAIEYVETNRPPGNMLNEYSLGGFLLYSLRTPRHVFIDGRADMYGEKIFSDYGKMADMEEGAEELLDEYKIDWIVFPKERQIIKQLRITGGWDEVYTDEQVAVLIRNQTELAKR